MVAAGGEVNGEMMVTSLIIIGQPIAYLLFQLAYQFGWIGVLIEVLIYAVLYIVLKKNMDKIHEVLEKQAHYGEETPAAA